MKEKIKIEKVKKLENGITLVALVITIIVIIILATVTINMAFGERGLIRQAEFARNMAINSTQYETESMANLTAYLNQLIGEDSEIPLPDPTNEVDPGPVEPEKSEIEIAKESEIKFTDTTPLKDRLGNTVYIPGGFHVDKESEGTLVEDGIVIEDDYGNQFVWIPTGTYQTNTGEKTNELTRRQWGTTENTLQEPIPITGDAVANGFGGAIYYGEGDSRSCTESGDTNSIDAFLESANPRNEANQNGHGGFYIGRYEQGEENVCKAGVDAYVNVTRDEAKAQAEAMNITKPEIKATAQLISSYAWDTTLNFICQNSEYGYELATITSADRGNIGTGNKTQTGKYSADCYNNIYDFLGNCYEFTTEYSTSRNITGSGPCVCRGGYCLGSKTYVAHRGNLATTDSGVYWSFRVQLYV